MAQPPLEKAPLPWPNICGGEQLGVEPKIGGFYPPKWMVKIMENPMNKWMIWGYFFFGNTQLESQIHPPFCEKKFKLKDLSWIPCGPMKKYAYRKGFLLLIPAKQSNQVDFFNNGYKQKATDTTPQNKHGTWKWSLGKGDSYWKPSFPGSMLIFGGV